MSTKATPDHPPTLHTEGGLPRLILDKKRDRSYEDMAREAGGKPSSKALFNLVSRPMKTFPEPETLQGLSTCLHVPVRDVILATSVSLGLPVSTDLGGVILYGAQNLPTSSQDLLHALAGELLRLHNA